MARRRPVIERPGAGDLHAGSADRVIEVDVGGIGREGEGESFELLVEGRGGVVAGSGDAASGEVESGEGLEDVVELGRGEVDGDGLVSGDAAGVLEEADAVFVEGDAGDGELGGVFWGGMGLGAGIGGSGLARRVKRSREAEGGLEWLRKGSSPESAGCLDRMAGRNLFPGQI